nr:hypothetical protein 158p1_00085 [Serratia entomophila]ULG11147.1 hypothetical protein 345p_00111 [Serratia entomophila]ULG11469.1 hypothetical protein 398p_00118 [Serratia entomophila]
MFVEIAAPAIIVLEQQLCGARNIHGAKSTVGQRAGKGYRRQPAHATVVLILCGCQRGGGACTTVRVLVRSTSVGVDVSLGLKKVEAAALPCSPHRGATFSNIRGLVMVYRLIGTYGNVVY